VHIPSDAIRQGIELSAAALIPQEDIAALVGISRATLQKYYLDDWLRGKAKASRRVAFRLALVHKSHENRAISIA
jgi:DNA-binding XRE family transcriptional regulator